MDQDQQLPDAEARLLQKIRGLELSLIGLKDRHFTTLAGHHAERLLQSREQAETALADPDSKVRRAAIIAIVDHWGASPAFEEHCITTLLQDCDIDLRITALSALAKVYQGSSANKAIQLLIGILRNEADPENLRALAYLALFRVSGQPVNATIRMHVLTGQFRVPGDVDWSLVEGLASSQSGPVGGAGP